MTTPESPKPDPLKKFRPFVPENMEMREFTLRAVLLGLVLCVVLGAANAYLGLRAGITIAATYPAAVISMAVIRARKGTLLEENIARTAGAVGGAGEARAVFFNTGVLDCEGCGAFCRCEPAAARKHPAASGE